MAFNCIVRWWNSDLRLLQSVIHRSTPASSIRLHRRRRELDAVKPATTKYRENRSSAVLVKPTPTPSDPVRVGFDYVKPSSSVRDKGIYLDSDVSIWNPHVIPTSRGQRPDVLQIDRTSRTSHHNDYCLNSNVIVNASVVKDLGVFVDERLNFDSHIN